ncbi:hypothetical protein ThesuDRAFT_02343 [Thermaerobacter subterraneus DSM 13965]|uniref:Uncharacterized protein n=2 Tax=Thermaerobacter TaxID=73918 RepID=K6P0I0_9FIRM|nr:hypothetical protein ThesuDRAFT_02343 [Thermaerobacter subterraneus DSM 13965]
MSCGPDAGRYSGGTNRPGRQGNPPAPGPDMTAVPRVPGAILLGGHVLGALPLWLAGGRAAVPADLPGPPPLGLGLAVATRPCRRPGTARGADPEPSKGPLLPRDPLRERMGRLLEAAALRPGPPPSVLALAREAALALGAWPRAVAMALGGLRWAGPPPDLGSVAGLGPPGPAPVAGDAGGRPGGRVAGSGPAGGAGTGGPAGHPPEGAGTGAPSGPPPGDEGGWPSPLAAGRARAFAALPAGWLEPLSRGLLLAGPLPAATSRPDDTWPELPPPPEWCWAARWSQGPDPVLVRVLEREARWLAGWRRRLPADLPTDPRPRRPTGGAPGPETDPAGGGGRPAAAAGDPDRVLGALLREAAALGRFVRDQGLVPPAVATAGERLEAALRQLGWDPGGPGSPPAWPAWHVAWPVWALWLAPAGAGDGGAARRVARDLGRLGWWAVQLYPVQAGARWRLVAGPASSPKGEDPARQGSSPGRPKA